MRPRARAREVMIKKIANAPPPVVRLMDLIHNLNVMQESKPRWAISGNWDVSKINFDKSSLEEETGNSRRGWGGGAIFQNNFPASVCVIVFRLCVSVC